MTHRMATETAAPNFLKFYLRESIHFEAQTWPPGRVLDMLSTPTITFDILPKDSNNQDYVTLRIKGDCYDGKVEVDVILKNHLLSNEQKDELQDIALKAFPTSRDVHNWNKRKRLADAINRKCK